MPARRTPDGPGLTCTMTTRASLPAAGDARRSADSRPGRAGAAAPDPAPIGLSFSQDDALDDFPAEEDVKAGRWQPDTGKVRRRISWTFVLIGALLVAALGEAAWLWQRSRRTPPPAAPVAAPAPPATGTLAIETTPAGATVAIEGQERGTTPLSLALAPGTYSVRVDNAGASRVLTARISAGGEVVHHLDLAPAAPAAAPAAPAAGPPDGRPSPSGSPVRVDLPRPQPAAASPAWVSVVAPVELQVFENGSLIGTSGSERILLMAGRHTLRLVNTDLDFDLLQAVEASAGHVATLQVSVPNGVLFVNAVPWAEVLLDGQRIGETPIANYPAPIGAHEITLRNPKFAEQTRTVVVTATSPARVGVDLRQ
jgi:hypothetical protein